MTVTELGGARRGGEWWDWSDVKIAVEWLLDVGDVVCTERRAWKRVYDLPERALPPEVLADDPDDETCLRRLVGQAGISLGVATIGDLADYHRLKRDQVRAVLDATDLVAVSVEGWRDAGWADPAALEALSARGRHRTTLPSPFDLLVGLRGRCARSTSTTARGLRAGALRVHVTSPCRCWPAHAARPRRSARRHHARGQRLSRAGRAEAMVGSARRRVVAATPSRSGGRIRRAGRAAARALA
jgi:hypothetical protein